jgi:PAS domain S-box-containing protein
VDEAGRYTYVSPRIKDLLGYEPEEIMHKTPFDLMPPEEAKRIKETFIAAVKQHLPINSLENINLHKNGHPVVLETSGNPIFDTKGKFCGYRGIDRDISRRKEAENKLLEQTQKLEETNIALRVVLRESEITKEELEKNVLSNIKGLLLPYLTELYSKLIDEDQKFLMDIIMANINEITSLFTRKLKLEIEDLTPKEIQVADLIKQGRTNKEISKLLNITTSGVDHHRRNLRKKFDIKGKKVNLRSYLQKM